MILQGPRDVIRELKRGPPGERAKLFTPGGRLYWLARADAKHGLIAVTDEGGTVRVLDEERLEEALGDGPFDFRHKRRAPMIQGPSVRRREIHDSTKTGRGEHD